MIQNVKQFLHGCPLFCWQFLLWQVHCFSCFFEGLVQALEYVATGRLLDIKNFKNLSLRSRI